MRRNRITFTVIASLVISLNFGLTEAHPAVSTSNNFNCRLKVDAAHLSTNAVKKGRGSAVKVKARTICDAFQDQTQISIRIFKEGLFRDYGSKTFPLTSEKKSGFVVEHKTAEIPCVDGRLTKFYGKANATIVIKGHVINLGPASSEYIVPLCCGT